MNVNQILGEGHDEDQDDGFYVAISNEEDGVFIGALTKDGGKWRESTYQGTPPRNWGGGYMSYLTPQDIMQHLHKDYGRYYEVVGPLDDNEVDDYIDMMSEGEVVKFPKKHKGDLEDTHDCPKCGGDLQGGTYMGHKVKVCMPCKQVYLPPNSGIDQQGNKIKEGASDIGARIKALYQKIYNAGDDEIEYFYNDSPVFAQYWDEYEGDLDSIIAEVDPSELQVMLDEIESYVQQANLAEGDVAKLAGITALGIGAGLGANYLDQQAPRVEFDGKNGQVVKAYLEPAYSNRIPDNAMTIKGKDGKTYHVWSSAGKGMNSKSYHAAPVEQVKEGYSDMMAKERKKRLAAAEKKKQERKLVKDRKTGKMYDPDEQFNKTMNSPEVKAQMKRMAAKEGVAEGLDPDTTRLEQDVRDALENGDDYTAKQYARMASTPEAKKYLLNIIKQAMYIDDLGGETNWKGVAEGSKIAKYNIHAKAPKPKNQQEYDAIEKYKADLAKSYQPKKTQGVAEAAEDRKRNALWAQITSYEQRAKETKNDIKKQHLLKMADELRGKLAPTTEEKLAESLDELSSMIAEEPVVEGKPAKQERPEADYGDDYQDMVARVKKLAGMGPLKTVYDPQKRVYKNVPTAVQPKK